MEPQSLLCGLILILIVQYGAAESPLQLNIDYNCTTSLVQAMIGSGLGFIVYMATHLRSNIWQDVLLTLICQLVYVLICFNLAIT